MSLMNPASNSLASSSPIAYLLGSKKRRRACLTGLNPVWIFKLCSASLHGIPGMTEGCPVTMSQFSRRNSRNAASTSGFNCAPMEAVLLGSVGWTWNLTISSTGLKEVDLDLLSSITSSLFTVERSVVSSSSARALDSSSRASAAVLFSECYVRVASKSDDSVGSGNFELHVPVMGYSLKNYECLSP